jgi:hypothetical protein
MRLIPSLLDMRSKTYTYGLKWRFGLVLFLLFSLETMHAQERDTNSTNVFQVRDFEIDSTLAFNFISLSEIYPQSYEGIPPVLDEVYLQTQTKISQNYHELAPSNRALFLQRTGLLEGDCVYLKNPRSGEVKEISISDLPLVAFLNLYDNSSSYPFPEYYFMIGFRLPEFGENKIKSHFSGGLAAIGTENPFVLEPLDRMIFDSIPISQWPVVDSIPFTQIAADEKAYLYENEGFKFFVKDGGSLNFPYQRALLVFDKISNEFVISKLYSDREGSYVTRLKVEGSGDYFQQYTGKLLTNRGPILLGFIGFSFGCESIQFVDPSEKVIYILCDNRH